tara:strand:- start:7 stop:993 length:987 start_codon:yes stop_codon:yes gene_type:complete
MIPIIGRFLETEHVLPFDMFERELTTDQAKAARKLERLYHKGQKKAWEGKTYLAELLDKHDGVQVPQEQREAIRRLFAVILWGELAAWKISSKLADDLIPMEAKMAATAQAHDEARHFYVMRDYLEQIGPVPKSLPRNAALVVQRVLKTKSTVKMLLGMQLIIEPLALTLFHIVRKANLDPVLSDLLIKIEQDEARHVALGVLYLPELIKELSPREAAELVAWQYRQYMTQVEMLKEMSPDLEAIGCSAREAFETGRKKEALAIQLLADQMGKDAHVVDFFLRIADFKVEMAFPHKTESNSMPARLRRAIKAATKSRHRIQAAMTDAA